MFGFATGSDTDRLQAPRFEIQKCSPNRFKIYQPEKGQDPCMNPCIFTCIWLNFMVNVSKYTSPMDPMGNCTWWRKWVLSN